MIAEIDATSGQTLREYVYVNGQQIALVDDTGTQDEATYFVHNDHLGTPQKITDSAQTVVWAGSYAPFGEVTETVATIENNIRFPGQYADNENGLHYNYFRDYDPTLGRYVESDPIGIKGGLGTYTYVEDNPVVFKDPRGLQLEVSNPGQAAGSAVNEFNQASAWACMARMVRAIKALERRAELIANATGKCGKLKYQIEGYKWTTGCITDMELVIGWRDTFPPWTVVRRGER